MVSAGAALPGCFSDGSTDSKIGVYPATRVWVETLQAEADAIF
ncbi:hypothetical protein [Bailinhaonella thermotolerans]|nr:hypothetical protein [Bailinhaonella thermotolerans]